MLLSDLKIGNKANIVGFLQNFSMRRKLLALGLTLGSCLQVIRFSPFGGLIALHVRNSIVVLKNDDAQYIQVSIQ